MPGRHVRVEDGRFFATSEEPWLDLPGIDAVRLAGSFLEVTYRASLLDEPCRPLLRFYRADGSFADRIGPAPIVGAAIWIGRVPPNTVSLSISPTNRHGSFAFTIENVRTRWWPWLLLQGSRRNFRRARNAALARLIGWRPESDNDLTWAIGAIPLGDFEEWLCQRHRAMDSAHLDRPRHDWAGAAEITLVVTGCADAGALARTVGSLQRQAFPRWQALLVDTAEDDGDGRLVPTDLPGAIERLGKLDRDGLVGTVVAGDILPAHALAYLAEQHHQDPDILAFYGDELAAGRPILQPGLSPRLMASRPYLGRAVFASGFAAWTSDERRRFILANGLPARRTDLARAVKPLRRVLIETARSAPAETATRADPLPPGEVNAALIVPTCDHPALLDRLVASVRAKTRPGHYRLVIVDNGASDGPGKELLVDLERAPDVLVLRRRDPFNFSEFCNDAVAACDEDLLVFLNDDTEILSEGWLERLAAHAADPAIGAVGAKLTFPDGRLQHVGVLVGMGGGAGHFGAGAPGDDPGWAGRNGVVHDVSAVTGACLAVMREKFSAVGGFDAVHLPVELSDIDLCLKLNARGWQTIVDPHVHLLHEESASRGGATFRRLQVYDEQRAVFIERWRHVLRDDPTFHPGLSLYSMEAALG